MHGGNLPPEPSTFSFLPNPFRIVRRLPRYPGCATGPDEKLFAEKVLISKCPMKRMQNIERLILLLLKKSGNTLLRMQNSALAKNKNAHDLVTNADLASEKIIVDAIRKKHPSHSIYSEESRRDDLFSENCWVIDPLDGTNNYAYGFPIWGVSIAYAQKGKVVAGGLAFPPQGIVMYAEKGKGAKMDGKKMHVSKRSDILKAMTLVDAHLSGSNGEANLAVLGKISRQVFNVRTLGAAVYNIGYVAAGLADACVQLKLQPYDGAAGALLVREAGGKVTDMEGKEWKLDTPSMVATNGRVHEAILEKLR